MFNFISYIIILFILPKLIPLFYSRPFNKWNNKPLNLFLTLLSSNFLLFATYWNNYEVHNEEYITGNNNLLIGYHTRSTFDNFYILTYLKPKFIASYFFFNMPFISILFKWWGGIPSKGLNSSTTDNEFINILLNGNEPVLVLPGGSYEAYKLYNERYLVNWKNNPGFARLLVNYSKIDKRVFKTRIIPFYTKNGDDILINHPWWYDISGRESRKSLLEIRNGNYSYLLRLMFFGGLGLGFLPYPKPVKLDTYFGEPLQLKKNETSEEFGKRIQTALQNLINKVNKLPPRDKLIKKYYKKNSFIINIFYDIYNICYGIYIVIQNLMFSIFGMTLTIIAVPFFLIRGFSQNKKKNKSKKHQNSDQSNNNNNNDNNNDNNDNSD